MLNSVLRAVNMHENNEEKQQQSNFGNACLIRRATQNSRNS